MPQTVVHCQSQLNMGADAVWSALRDFDLAWHPGIKTCKVLDDANGSLLRQFTDSDGNAYIEERTYVSDTDRVLCYRLRSGIEGALSYHARVEVINEGKARSAIIWRAEIAASKERLDAIADGTRSVFEAAFKALEQATPTKSRKTRTVPPASSGLARVSLDGCPTLSALHTVPAQADDPVLVLFLHGIGGQASNWTDQLKALGDNYVAAALDLRGYGNSTLGFGPSQIEDYCSDILNVMHAFASRRVVLVGLSYGSWIATSFAMRNPEKLAGLVLLGGCTGMSEADEKERESFRISRTDPLNAGQRPADFASAVIDVLAGPDTTPRQRETLVQSMAEIAPETYRDALNCFCNPPETFDFSRIACPVLLMTGEHDLLASPDEIRRVSERILDATHNKAQSGDVRFEVIRGAGHVCNIDKADEINSRLLRFLERLSHVPLNYKPKPAVKKQIKRSRILSAAHDEFCDCGFDGTSMERLAERAGVSKPTLYQYFGDKEGLFAAVLDVGRGHLIAPLSRHQGTLVDWLWDFSWTYAEFVLRPDMLSLARLILGEAGRRPESAKAYHAAGPGKAFEGIVSFVQDCIDEGDLRAEDAELAANDLWSLILSGPRDYYLHHVEETPDKDSLLRSIHHGIRVFLSVYSVQPENDLAALEQKVAEWRAYSMPPKT